MLRLGNWSLSRVFVFRGDRTPPKRSGLNGAPPKGDYMTVVIVLLALSAVVGFALGTSFSWPVIVACGIGFATFSAAALRVTGFGALSGIAIIVACLTVNQLAYFARVVLANRRLKEANKSRERRKKAARGWPT
jgi:hypothetical protein